MLKQRVLTAIPLAIAAIWVIFYQPTEILFYAFLASSAVAGWEWARLSGLNQIVWRIVYALVIVAAVFFLAQLSATDDQVFNTLMVASIIWWLYVLYRMSTTSPAPANDQLSIIKIILGFITLIPAILALTHIHAIEQGSFWLFYVLSIVWVADIGAYFTGKKFGKHKLAPLVSPGKTKEGLYGALVATMLYTFAAAIFFELNIIQTSLLIIIAFFATLLSVIGDLYISVLKRERGVKDSGSILPGHGGILDRIDSVTSSAPFMVVLLNWVIFNV